MLRRLLPVLRRASLAVLGLLVLAGIWEGYKAVAPDDGVKLFGVRALPRTDDSSMPHLSRIWHAFFLTDVNQSVAHKVFFACLHTLRWATLGFVIGVLVGALLALLMDRLAVAERAILPWIVLSQTVPLIALAPMVKRWGDGWSILGWTWQPSTSVSVIAAYLAFFPVAIGLSRGLKSPEAVHRDYFRVTASGWWRTLVRLKFPAAVPFLIPALRLGAAAAVVGTIVAEISTGLQGGIGRLIIDYSAAASDDPSKLYASVVGAAVLGLFVAAVITFVDLALARYRKTGENA